MSLGWGKKFWKAVTRPLWALWVQILVHLTEIRAVSWYPRGNFKHMTKLLWSFLIQEEVQSNSQHYLFSEFPELPEFPEKWHHCKPYWQPMNRTKPWNTASKWWRLCHQAGQSILNTLALWGQCGWYHTKVNCNNWDDRTQEQLQVILHYPDQGDGKYVADPAYGNSMSSRLLIYVSGRWSSCRKLPQDSEQI